MSNNTDRFFPNPYPDYDDKIGQDFIDQDFWKEFIIKSAQICLQMLNEKCCDGGIYSGNLGLIYMNYKLIKCGRFKENEPELKKYMNDCLVSNENYQLFNDIKKTKDIGLMSGKGGDLKKIFHLFYHFLCCIFRI
jgi:hypothetical protein